MFALVLIFCLAASARAEESAKQLAVEAHAKAAAVDDLPQFLIRGHGRTKVDYLIKDPEEDPISNLVRALDPDVAEEEWYRFEGLFAWDEEHYLTGFPAAETVDLDRSESWHPDGTPPFQSVWWGTRHLSGQRGSGPCGPAQHVLRADAAALWKDYSLSFPNYVLATRHEFWWGDNGSPQQHFGTSDALPAQRADYQHVGTETFDGDLCDVVVSPMRMERLWICRNTGLIRGLASYAISGRVSRLAQESQVSWWQSDAVKELAGRTFDSYQDYLNWYRGESHDFSVEQKWSFRAKQREFTHFNFEQETSPTLMVRFRDFREIAPGIWWPFCEDRAQGRPTADGFNCMVSNFIVHHIRTDMDLREIVDALKPKEGEQVQDQRYLVAVNYRFRADMTEPEILKLVDEEQKRRLEGEAFRKQITEPIEQMVGRRAPELPNDGWIGGFRPDLEGKPYLIHFWATRCGPCKNDFPLLKRMSNQGALIIGMHPAGTPADEVKEVMQENQLTYPTLLATEGDSSRKIAGYPAAIFPYCILVDGQGNVTAHASLRENNGELVNRYYELQSSTKADDSR